MVWALVCVCEHTYLEPDQPGVRRKIRESNLDMETKLGQIPDMPLLKHVALDKHMDLLCFLLFFGAVGHRYCLAWLFSSETSMSL